jgi:serine/threonine protein kinase
MPRCPGCFKSSPVDGLCRKCERRHNGPGQSDYALPIGTVLNDNYVLGSVLGSGGFGITYMAWDTNAGEAVAVKEYMPIQFARRVESRIYAMSEGREADFDEGIRKFRQEAEILSKNNSENIVRVRAQFTENETAYFVMEYLGDQTLAQYVRTQYERTKSPLTYERTFDILTHVMDALHHAHTKLGIIHRDVSPENICITQNRTIKLIDFGQAKAAFQGSRGPERSQVVVKGGYSPPELYEMGYSQTRPFIDVYSVAATFYFCLTGAEPVQASTRQNKVFSGSTDPLPAALPPGVMPTAAREALLKALRLVPAERYQTIRELQLAITYPDPPLQASQPQFPLPQAPPVPQPDPLPQSQPSQPPAVPQPTQPAPVPQPAPQPAPVPQSQPVAQPPRPLPLPQPQDIPGWPFYVAICVAGLAGTPLAGYVLMAHDVVVGWAVTAVSLVFLVWLIILLKMKLDPGAE